MTNVRRSGVCHIGVAAAGATPMLMAVLAAAREGGGLLAYVGPGAGLTMLGALLAVAAIVILGLLGPILYPIRLIVRWHRRREHPEAATNGNGGGVSGSTERIDA